MQRENIGVVGGVLDTVGLTPRAEIIARAMHSRFGVGGVAFRTQRHKTMLVDTVAFAAFKRTVLDRAGPFDEEFVRNQDDEFNYRLLKMGVRILLASDLHVRYYSRSSLRGLWQQYFSYGYWKPRVMQKHPLQMRLRHFIPLVFVSLLIGSALLAPWSPFALWVFLFVAGSYAIVNGLAAFLAGGKNFRRCILLSQAFTTMHVAYGFGFICGLGAIFRRAVHTIVSCISESGSLSPTKPACPETRTLDCWKGSSTRLGRRGTDCEADPDPSDSTS